MNVFINIFVHVQSNVNICVNTYPYVSDDYRRTCLEM